MSSVPDDRDSLLSRITIDARQCGGKPCIRGMRIRVRDVMELLAAGVPAAQVPNELTALTAEDVAACIAFSERHARRTADEEQAPIRFEEIENGDFVSIRKLDVGTDGTLAEDDLLLDVFVRSASFSASTDTWVLAAEWRSFVEGLRIVESTRAGAATLRSMSPDEFEITVAVVDRAGHTTATGFVGRRLRRASFGDDACVSRICFDVRFDPSQLPHLVRELSAIA